VKGGYFHNCVLSVLCIEQWLQVQFYLVLLTYHYFNLNCFCREFVSDLLANKMPSCDDVQTHPLVLHNRWLIEPIVCLPKKRRVIAKQFNSKFYTVWIWDVKEHNVTEWQRHVLLCKRLSIMYVKLIVFVWLLPVLLRIPYIT
jgi:hypothetical protein